MQSSRVLNWLWRYKIVSCVKKQAGRESCDHNYAWIKTCSKHMQRDLPRNLALITSNHIKQKLDDGYEIEEKGGVMRCTCTSAGHCGVAKKQISDLGIRCWLATHARESGRHEWKFTYQCTYTNLQFAGICGPVCETDVCSRGRICWDGMHISRFLVHAQWMLNSQTAPV